MSALTNARVPSITTHLEAELRSMMDTVQKRDELVKFLRRQYAMCDAARVDLIEELREYRSHYPKPTGAEGCTERPYVIECHEHE